MFFFSSSQALPLPLALTSKLSLPKSISRPREPQIIVKDSLPYVFQLGVALFSSSLGKKGGLKVCKLGLNGLIILGCFK